MSFLKRLFSGGAPSAPKPDAETLHEGYTITATPMSDGGQYRLHGTISKEIDGEVKSHTLIRADMFADRAQCAEATIAKGKQVIAEQGDGMFH